MKVALCLSGHTRTYRNTFPLLETRLLNVVQPDIFISTWDTISSDKSYFHWHHKDLNINFQNKIDNDHLSNLYKPKKIIIDTFDNQDERFLMSKRFGKNVCSNPRLCDGDLLFCLPMYYKLNSCNNLKIQYEQENNFKYDVVIRFRFDNYFEQPVSKDYLNNLQEEVFYKNNAPYGEYDDIFWICKSSTMDKTCNIHKDVHNLNITSGEQMITQYINSLNLRVEPFPDYIKLLRK